MTEARELTPYKPVETTVTNTKLGIRQESSMLCGETLRKGQYDIHYVISVLKIILHQKPHFGLSESIRRLLAHLEVERDQQFPKC